MLKLEKAWLWFYVIFATLFALIVFYPAGEAHSGEAQESALKPVCAINILPNGMVETLYDIDGDGVPDWMTLHRTTREQQPAAHPLFFGYSPGPKTGQWNVVLIDRAEDGLNGNEELYFQAE